MKPQTHSNNVVAKCGLILLLTLTLFPSTLVPAQAQASKPTEQEKPFVVEYYYKAKWGYAAEFIRLFKKNHYPLLLKEMEEGRILRVTAASPAYHSTEEGRWDYRVEIVWKSAAVANDDYDGSINEKKLYPDQETFRREEQRRFEILLGHWDVPVVTVDLKKQ
ncbi:MAG: hypothetical protein ACR2L2_00660 [Acidobacteriota bacterium]